MTDRATLHAQLYEKNKPNVFPKDSVFERAIIQIAGSDAEMADDLQDAILDLMVKTEPRQISKKDIVQAMDGCFRTKSTCELNNAADETMELLK